MSIAGYSPLVIYPDIADLDLWHYKTGLQAFIDKCSLSLSEETAFYTFGSVSTPGVSDIDLLMIVRDEEWQRARQIAHEIILSSGFLYYLFSHEPVIAPKSMAPHLYFLHTLENCIQVHGKSDPLANIYPSRLQNMQFLRHAVWASFMRIAALELDRTCIGLRRTLILMHNLLISATCGNNFLNRPLMINLSTDEIRHDILSAPLIDQERRTRSFLKNIVDLLNKVDERLDEEMNKKDASEPAPSSRIPLSRERCLIPLLQPFSEAASAIDTFEGRETMLIPVPNYQVALTAKLAVCVSKEISGLEVFLDRNDVSISNISEKSLSVCSDYAAHMMSVIRKCDESDIRFFFPAPFGIMLDRRKRLQIVRQLRRIWRLMRLTLRGFKNGRRSKHRV